MHTCFGNARKKWSDWRISHCLADDDLSPCPSLQGVVTVTHFLTLTIISTVTTISCCDQNSSVRRNSNPQLLLTGQEYSTPLHTRATSIPNTWSLRKLNWRISILLSLNRQHQATWSTSFSGTLRLECCDCSFQTGDGSTSLFLFPDFSQFLTIGKFTVG